LCLPFAQSGARYKKYYLPEYSLGFSDLGSDSCDLLLVGGLVIPAPRMAALPLPGGLTISIGLGYWRRPRLSRGDQFSGGGEDSEWRSIGVVFSFFIGAVGLSAGILVFALGGVVSARGQ